ncbi:hypothetical protein ACXN5S_08410 [Pseudoroseicyclus sp. H15]
MSDTQVFRGLDSRAAALSRRIETVLETASARIGALQDEIAAASEALTRASEFAAPTGRERLARSAAGAGAHVDRVQAQFRQHSQTASALHGPAEKLGRLLEDLLRDMKLTAFIATNAKVVSHTVPGADDTLGQFAEDVRACLTGADSSVKGIQEQLTHANRQLGQLVTGLRDMSETAADLQQTRSRLPGVVAGLANTTPLQQSGSTARTGLLQVSQALGELSAPLKAAAMVQARLSRARQIAARSGSAGGSSGPVLEHLAAAQIHAAVKALDESLASALPALSRAAGPWRSAQEAMRDISMPDSGGPLGQLPALCAAMSAGLAALDARHKEIAPRMGELAAAYERGADSARKISALEEQMNLLSINAILVSGRAGQHGQAMTEVSRQLRESTAEIGRATQAIVQLALRQQSEAQGFGAAEGEGAEDEVSIGAMQADIAALLASMEALAATAGASGDDPLAELSDLLGGLKSEAQADLPQLDGLPAITPPDAALSAQLQQIRAGYDTRAERDVHDRLFAAAGREASAGWRQVA